MKNEKKRLIIIDGNALVHRAYHALPPLSTKKGEIVNAVYGFLLVFLKAIKEFQPDFIAATFDLRAPTFRHEKFKEYKATRKKAPDELYSQMPKIKELLKNFNVPIFEKEGFEADDVIGTIAKLAQIPHQKFGGGQEIETIILTGDLDALQLINRNTKVYTLRRGLKDTILYDEKAVREKYDGLGPEQMSDFKALKGDVSDNVPGIPGIGEKTAISLIKEFRNLENLYKEIENINPVRKSGALDPTAISFGKGINITSQPPQGAGLSNGVKVLPKEKIGILNPRLLTLLKDYKDQAFFNKTLTDIDNDAPIDFNIEVCNWNGYDQEKVVQNLKEFEFYSLIERLPQSSKINKTKTTTLNLETPTGIMQQIEIFYKDGFFSKKIYEIEKELIPVIKKIEENGIKIDLKALKQLSEKLEGKIIKLERDIFKSAGTEFNINSPQQLSEVLFQKLKISPKGFKKNARRNSFYFFSGIRKTENRA